MGIAGRSRLGYQQGLELGHPSRRGRLAQTGAERGNPRREESDDKAAQGGCGKWAK